MADNEIITTKIQILESGLQTTLQDFGRFGYRSFGIAKTGAIDNRLLEIGNHLLKQNPSRSGLEFALTGPKIKILKGSIEIVLMANSLAKLTSASSTDTIHPFQSYQLKQNDILSIEPLRLTSYGYLCFAGVIEVAKVLGSYSTDLTAKFGGFKGRCLKQGDILNIYRHKANNRLAKINDLKLNLASETIRIIAEDDSRLFHDSIANNQNYKVSLNKNRMGVRLIGPPLQPKKKDISLISEAQSIGTVQITGDNQPIVLLNDCQTIGGYPKVASVIRADLPKLAQLQSHANVSFIQVSKEQALLAYHQLVSQIKSIKRNITYAEE